VSIGSLYEYFPNKDSILVELSKRHLQGRALLAPVIRRLRDDPPPIDEGLAALMHAMVQAHCERPRLQRVMYAEALRPPELQDRYARAIGGLTEVIERYLAARPEVSVRDRRVAAELVAEVIWHITHGPIVGADVEREPESYAAETVALLTRYLTA
jgi:AcrR family transcriptional regulator